MPPPHMSSVLTPSEVQASQQKLFQQQQRYRERYRERELLTPEMRDRQARGKDPYSKSEMNEEDAEEYHDEGMPRPGHGSHMEPYEDRERRAFALSVLDNPEQLLMYAQSTGDSVASQRHRFTAMLCGFDDPQSELKNSNSHHHTPKGNASSGGGSSSHQDGQGRRAGDRVGR